MAPASKPIALSMPDLLASPRDPADLHDPRDNDHRRLNFWLLVLCVLAITHGSLYPWIFHPPAAGLGVAWDRLWAWMDRPLWTSGGDVIGNVVLFIPLGMLAWRASAGWRCGHGLRLLIITLASVAFALALQVVQIWLPTRSAAVSDVVWNALGLALGLPAAPLTQRPIEGLARRLRSVHLLAYLVALAWLLLQWWPLLPQLHRSVLWQAWQQLQHLDQWQAIPALLSGLSLLVVMHLIRGLRGRAWVAVGLLLTALLGSFVFVNKAGATVGIASSTVGWCIALLLGPWVWRLNPRSADRWMLAAAAVGGLLSSLRPGVFSPSASVLEIRPFVALLNEPRVAHTSAFLWEGFWILTLLLLGQRLGWRLPWAVLVLTLVVAVLELIQRWLPGQQADVTPLLLPAVCAWLLARLLQRHERLHGPAASTMPR